jgi:hypothetical protein
VNWLRIGAWWAVGLVIYLTRRALGGDTRTGAEVDRSVGVVEEAPSPATV